MRREFARHVHRARRWAPLSAKSAVIELPDRLFQLFRLGLRRIARHRLAVAVDQEFGEIPFDDLGAQNAGLVAS